MDITKMMISAVKQTEKHNGGADKTTEKGSFDSILKEHKKNVVNENNQSNELTNQSHVDNKEELNNHDIHQLIEKLEKDDVDIKELLGNLINKEEALKEDSEGYFLNILIMIMSLLIRLEGGSPVPMNVAKNPDGSINVDELKKVLKDLTKQHEELMKDNEDKRNGKVEDNETNTTKVVNKLEKLVDLLSRMPSKDENKSIEKLIEKLSNIVKNPENKDSLASLKEEISSFLVAKTEGKGELSQKSQEEMSFTKDEEASKVVKSDKSSEKPEEKKEDKFLKSLISEENKVNDKFSINAFKTSFGKVDVVKAEPIITKNNAVFDTIKTIKFMQTNSLKELTVKIYPKELGEITISISQEKDVMKANIKANSKDAYAILNNNLVDIKKNLAEQNIKIQEVNISLYNDDTTFYREGQENKSELFQEHLKKNNSIGDVLQEEVVEENLHNGNVNMLA